MPNQTITAPDAVGRAKRYVQVTWSDDGKHEVQIVGIRRRADLELLLKAARRHAFACQVRGLPIDTPRTQRPTRVEEAETLVPTSGE